MRVTTDPVTGYVPRSEISEMRDALHERIDRTNERIDGMRTWVIGLFIAFISAALTTISIIVSLAGRVRIQ